MLTEQQRADLQSDLGIGADESVFIDAQLDRLYERAEGDYDLALIYALRQLRTDAAKFADYTQNASSEQRSQVFEHLTRVLADAETKAGLIGSPLAAGALLLGLDEVVEQPSP